MIVEVKEIIAAEKVQLKMKQEQAKTGNKPVEI